MVNAVRMQPNGPGGGACHMRPHELGLFFVLSRKCLKNATLFFFYWVSVRSGHIYFKFGIAGQIKTTYAELILKPKTR